MSKRPYTKPTLRAIVLAAQEVLAIGCKSLTTAGPEGGPCVSAACATVGS